MVNIDRVPSPDSRTHFIRTDLTDYGQVVEALCGIDEVHRGVDPVVHLAAIPGATFAPTSPPSTTTWSPPSTFSRPPSCSRFTTLSGRRARRCSATRSTTRRHTCRSTRTSRPDGLRFSNLVIANADTVMSRPSKELMAARARLRRRRPDPGRQLRADVRGERHRCHGTRSARRGPLGRRGEPRLLLSHVHRLRHLSQSQTAESAQPVTPDSGENKVTSRIRQTRQPVAHLDVPFPD